MRSGNNNFTNQAGGWTDNSFSGVPSKSSPWRSNNKICRLRISLNARTNSCMCSLTLVLRVSVPPASVTVIMCAVASMVEITSASTERLALVIRITALPSMDNSSKMAKNKLARSFRLIPLWFPLFPCHQDYPPSED